MNWEQASSMRFVAAKAEFVAGVNTLAQDQQDNLKTFLRGSLVEFFEVRRDRIKAEASYVRLGSRTRRQC